MKNLKEAERAAAEEENSDIETHLTISRQDVYDQVKKGSILNDRQRPGRGRSCNSRDLVNGKRGDGKRGEGGNNCDSDLKLRSAQTVRKTRGKDESRLRRSPRSPIKSDEQSPRLKRRSVGRGGLNGETALVSPGRCRPNRNRK